MTMPPDDNLTNAALSGITKVASDVYADVARPSAQRVGGALDTLFKVGLAPVAMLDWGFDRSKEWLQRKIEERLAHIPEDVRVPPPSNIAVPALLQIAMCADAPELRELYAELLLKAMDARTVSTVHPAYVSLIGQLSPPEALVYLSFGCQGEKSLFTEDASSYTSPTIEHQFGEHCASLGFQDPKLARVWLDNLQRLGLLVIERYSDVTLKGDDYDRPARVDTKETRYLELTEFGRSFLATCTPSGVVHEA